MRLFLGIDVGADARGVLGQAVARLRPRAPKAKWVPEANLHATLVFLGQIADGRVDDVRRAIDSVTSRHAAMAFRLAGGGAFGSKKRPRVLFAAMSGDVERLARLHADLEEALTPFGYQPEKRDYRPHVTLARARDPRGEPTLAACVEELASLEPVQIPVADVVLYQSRLSPKGPTYEVLHRSSVTK